MKKIIDAIKKALGMDKKSSDSSQGFTLIELLVVIAVIGILAAGILVAVNPLEQIRRSQDSSTKQQVSSVGRAVEAFYVNSVSGTNPEYPDGANWLGTDLAGEFKTTPNSGTTPPCTTGTNPFRQNGFCLKHTAANIANPYFVVYTSLRSETERRRARESTIADGTTPTGCTSTNNTYYVYSSRLGKAGIVCDEPTETFNGTLY